MGDKNTATAHASMHSFSTTLTVRTEVALGDN